MKIRPPFSGSIRGAPPSSVAAFTLVEIMVAMSVFVLLLGGVVVANLCGLKMLAISTTKLTATQSAREAVGKLTDEIRTSKSVYVGNVTNGVFVALPAAAPQVGAGVLIYPTTNTTNFILYFVNPSDQSFRRTTSVPGTTTVLAQSLTNSVAFTAQDCLGNVLTNSQNNRVIHLDLEFYQAQGLTPADYYKLETSVTRRALN
jgi:hypothetical protein